MKNAADHTTVIHARLAGLSVGQMRLKRRPGFV